MSAEEIVQERMAKAFFHSMDEDTAFLSDDVILDVLADLGLLPRSQEDRSAVSALLDETDAETMSGSVKVWKFEDFEDLTQLAREQVMFAQRPRIEKHFLELHGERGQSRSINFDFDVSRVDDLLTSLGCGWPPEDSLVIDEIRSTFAECPQPDEDDEQEVFHAIVQHAQERLAEVHFDKVRKIQEQTGLSHSLARAFRSELTSFYMHFSSRLVKYDEEERKSIPQTKIDFQGVRTLLGDLGVVPTNAKSEGAIREFVSRGKTLLRKVNDGQCNFDFPEFLKCVEYVRKVYMRRQESRLRQLFDKHVRQGANALDYRGTTKVLQELGHTPRTREQQKIIADILMDLDMHGRSDLKFQQLERLVCRITESKEEKHRAQLKAYAWHFGIDYETLQ
jgi:hypothetical protein